MAISLESLAARDGSEQRLRATAPFPSLSSPAGDEALVLAAKNGNEEAFEILVKRYRHRMIAVALRLTRVREDAEDVTQQSFQKAFVHLHEFEGKSSFSTWLTRITVNEALMLLRRGRRHREVSIDEGSVDVKGDASHLEIPDSDPDPEASYLQREAARILSAAMGKLRPGLRKVIELRDLRELSTEETARRVGLSVSATKSSVSRGRRKLREALCEITSKPQSTGRQRQAHLARSPHLRRIWLRLARKEALMWTILLIVLLVVLIFLAVTGTEGIEDRKHRR